MAQDDKMKLGITLDVDANGTELIDALQRKVNALAKSMAAITANMRKAASVVSSPGRSATSSTDSKAEVRSASDLLALDRASVAEFRRKLTLKTRMAAQHAKEERDSLKAYKDRVSFQSRATAQAEKEEARPLQSRMRDEAQAFRQRFAFGTRMGRQAVQEEKARAREAQRSIAETARADAQRMRERAAELRDGHRREIAETQRHEREIARHESQRSRGYSDLRSGGSDFRQGLSRATMGAGVITAAGTAAAGSAARKGISTRMEVDTAETNLRIFSGQTTEQIKAARRGFLDNEAIKNGLGIAGGLNTYNEVLKAGIKSPELNTKTIMQAVSALELDLASTTKLAGLLDRNFGASSTPAKLKSALNAVAVAAREDPTNAGEIVEGVKRGFSSLSTGNMTPEQMTALVSGAQSSGIQAVKSGTYISTLGKQLSMGSSKFLDPKNRKELNFAAKELGFGDARQMAKTYTSDSYNTIVKLSERLNAMEAGKRTNVAEALMGRMWSDETLQNAQAVEGQKKTYAEIMSPGSANFREEAARQRAESLQGQWNSTKSIFSRFWDSFGAGFEDILISINRYFLDLNSSFDYNKVKSYVVSFFDGVKDALGVKTWQELLHNTFGGNLGNYGQQIRDFGKGLTEGIMGFVRGVRSVFEVFAGSNASAETIGRFAGQFLALTAALIVSGPAIALLNGIGLAVMGVATVALGAWRILRAAGLVSATGIGSTPKVPETPGKGISRLGGRLGAAGAAAGFAGTSSLSKGEQDALSKRLGSWAQDREKLSAPSTPATPWIDPPARNAIETLKEAVEENTLLHRQNFEAENGFRGLIHKASLSTTAPAESVKAVMTGAAGSIQAAMSGSIGGGGVSGSPLSTSVPGSSLGGASGLSRRGIIGGGYGGGGGGITAPMLKGDAQANAKTAYDFFRSKGLSHEATSGILASVKQESGFNPGARGDGGKAHGLFQHHPDRRAAIMRGTGVDMSNASVADQLKGAWWEMNHGDAGAQRARKILQTPGITARDAGGAFVQHFERPAKDERASRGAMAEGFAREFGPNSGGIGGAGQYSGLRAKGSQAYGGGASHVGITDLARQVQENLPGGVKHFGAFNDKYHQGTRSKHAQGLAFDTTLLDLASLGKLLRQSATS
ncbi:phage tail tip lysozyme [Methylobacterium sp. Leaf100]|uniref:phage tail tip lysozyme n=1 Tax=Methylobacterium sp. Leaf100 TaxID=1736252 RepID=UPI0009EB9DE8|nr:phage tail tip lysozyme [Methylobacterium sp. Leaf100]